MKQSNKQISQINSYCIHENWKKLKCGYVIVSGFYPYTCGHSLRPVKNRRSFDKVVDQNFPLLFTGQTTPLTKLSLEGKEAQNRRENKSEMGGNFSPKLGGEVASDFDFIFGGIEATGQLAKVVWRCVASLLELLQA